MGMTQFELYSDERFVETNDTNLMLLGGIVCSQARRDRIQKELCRVRKERGMTKELKWTKISKRYLDGYKKWLDCFFDDPHARFSYLVVNRTGDAWKRFCDSPQGASRRRFSSVFCQFLWDTLKPIGDDVRWTVYHDKGFFRRPTLLKQLEFLINHTSHTALGTRVVRRIRHSEERDSKNCDLIQLTDVILGCLSCALISAPSSEARKVILGHFRLRLGCVPQTRGGKPKLAQHCWVPPDEYSESRRQMAELERENIYEELGLAGMLMDRKVVAPKRN
jgi:hypothetical protein